VNVFIDDLEELLKGRIALRCEEVSGVVDDYLLVELDHRTTSGLSKGELAELKKQLGEQDELYDYLSKYSSLQLYRDVRTGEYAYYLAPPKEWEAIHENFREWFEDFSDIERGDIFPIWVNDAFAFGEMVSSGNYYLYIFRNDLKGHVFEFEHDGFEFNQVASRLSDFIKMLCEPTDDTVRDLRSYVRYSDGKTEYQWMPHSFL